MDAYVLQARADMDSKLLQERSDMDYKAMLEKVHLEGHMLEDRAISRPPRQHVFNYSPPVSISHRFCTYSMIQTSSICGNLMSAIVCRLIIMRRHSRHSLETLQ